MLEVGLLEADLVEVGLLEADRRADAERADTGSADVDNVLGTGAAAFEALVQTGVVMAPR